MCTKNDNYKFLFYIFTQKHNLAKNLKILFDIVNTLLDERARYVPKKEFTQKFSPYAGLVLLKNPNLFRSSPYQRVDLNDNNLDRNDFSFFSPDNPALFRAVDSYKIYVNASYEFQKLITEIYSLFETAINQ